MASSRMMFLLFCLLLSFVQSQDHRQLGLVAKDGGWMAEKRAERDKAMADAGPVEDFTKNGLSQWHTQPEILSMP